MESLVDMDAETLEPSPTHSPSSVGDQTQSKSAAFDSEVNDASQPLDQHEINDLSNLESESNADPILSEAAANSAESSVIVDETPDDLMGQEGKLEEETGSAALDNPTNQETEVVVEDSENNLEGVAHVESDVIDASFEMPDGEVVSVEKEGEIQTQGDTDKAADEEKEEKLVTLPLAKIKKIMRTDPDTTIISKEAMLLTAKATELFVREFSSFSYEALRETKRKTISKKEFDAVLTLVEPYCFLEGIFDEPEPEPESEPMEEEHVETATTDENATAPLKPSPPKENDSRNVNSEAPVELSEPSAENEVDIVNVPGLNKDLTSEAEIVMLQD